MRPLLFSLLLVCFSCLSMPSLSDSFTGQLTEEVINSFPLSNIWPQPVSFKLLASDATSMHTLQILFPLQILLFNAANEEPILRKSLPKDGILAKILTRYETFLEQDFLSASLDYGFPVLLNEACSLYEQVSQISVTIGSLSEDLDLTTDESYSIKVHSLQDHNAVVDASKDKWVICLKAANCFGLMKAFETLCQLGGIRSRAGQLIRVLDRAPFLLEDHPRFPHRGLMVDTSRHFIPMSNLLALLPLMGHCKLNVFHWHIVDAQSFPILLDSVPELAQKGAYSRSQIYMPEDVQLFVATAKEWGIRVIPEYDIPGHTASWGSAYPELLTARNEQDWQFFSAAPPAGQLNPILNETYELIGNIINDSAELFPDSFFHIGCDEVVTNCWTSNPSIAHFMHNNGWSETQLLQYFFDRVTEMLSNKKKITLAWEDSVVAHKILPRTFKVSNSTRCESLDLDEDSTDEQGSPLTTLSFIKGKFPDYIKDLQLPKDNVLFQVWRNASSGKDLTSRGYSILSSIYTDWYLDIGQSQWLSYFDDNAKVSNPVPKVDPRVSPPMYSWQKMYDAEPTSGLEASLHKFVLGGEAAMWCEVTDANNIHTVIFPRLFAVAERLWSPMTEASKLSPWTIRRLDVFIRHLNWRDCKIPPIRPQFCSMFPDQC